MGAFDRLKHAWNAFVSSEEDDYQVPYSDAGVTYGVRPDRRRFSLSNEQSIISSIYTRVGIDVAALAIRHVRLDEDGRYFEDIKSGLDYCLNEEANIDQPARHFRQDLATTTIENGVSVAVAVEASIDPATSTSYNIQNMRVGEVVSWMPEHVRVRLYNERKGRREEIVLPKRQVAIIENPLYSVMNEPNSTLQRLIRKLNMLDAIDEQSASGKMDLIIQLPYVVKSDAKREQAEQRRKDIEVQLTGSKYGIAYVDGTEKITQLNRPAENNLMNQIEYLTTMLYGQLGLTEEVMNGTADETAMLNYYNRTIEPISAAIVESLRRTYLTKTARTQNQSLIALNSPFKLVPLEKIADIADKFTRNEIMTSNELRQIIGFKPSKDPKADKLQNSNMPQEKQEAPKAPMPPVGAPGPEGVGDDDNDHE